MGLCLLTVILSARKARRGPEEVESVGVIFGESRWSGCLLFDWVLKCAVLVGAIFPEGRYIYKCNAFYVMSFISRFVKRVRNE